MRKAFGRQRQTSKRDGDQSQGQKGLFHGGILEPLSTLVSKFGWDG